MLHFFDTHPFPFTKLYVHLLKCLLKLAKLYKVSAQQQQLTFTDRYELCMELYFESLNSRIIHKNANKRICLICT